MLPSLREWQVESIKCWTEAKFHGCFEVATGGGKTTFALACFDALRQEKPNLKCLVVVPNHSAQVKTIEVVISRLAQCSHFGLIQHSSAAHAVVHVAMA